MSLTPVETSGLIPLCSKFGNTKICDEIEILEEQTTEIEEDVAPAWYHEEDEDSEPSIDDINDEIRSNFNNNKGACSMTNQDTQILKVESAPKEQPNSAEKPTTWNLGPYMQHMRDLLPKGEHGLRKLADSHLGNLKQENLKLEDKRDSLLSKIAAKVPSASMQMRMHYFIANKVSFDRLFQEAKVEKGKSQSLRAQIERYNAVVDISKKLDGQRTRRMETDKLIEKQKYYVNKIGEPTEGKTAELSKELTVLRNRYLKAQNKIATTPVDEFKNSRPQTQL